MFKLRTFLEKNEIKASAPCRVDMGGTLDLSTFSLPLRHLKPCTFNAALSLRTRVRLLPYHDDRIKISSHGFPDMETTARDAPFNHPLGLMLAIAAYFNADGVHIDIESASPPRSALGGSSVAAVAIIWAFAKALAQEGLPMLEPAEAAMLAHAIEQSVAGVPCGMQDHLAAAFGGVNAWHWTGKVGFDSFRREQVVPTDESSHFSSRMLVAYCGEPHQSSDINGSWVRSFIAGRHRSIWEEITDCTRRFIGAVSAGRYSDAQEAMNRETDLRCQMTPEVLDEVGKRLVNAARDHGCGARFTGAGGGGCLWALGSPEQIMILKAVWQQVLSDRTEGKILECSIDTAGVL